MPLQPGTRLGPYEIITLIGAGGMGEVWLATELRLGRKVALKLLPPNLTSDAVRIQRFEQEARAASALNHPNVCTIYALDQTSDGQHYIAMEYVEGDTLAQRLVTSRLSIREALDIAIQVAAALSVAHATGIVHRDIKPENVMLRPDGVVKVLDFGLAKLAAAASAGTATRTELGVHTDPGKVVGTAAYMSPEQARGQQVDTRTDIWSLGVMLYEMIAGCSPFSAPSGSDVLAAILQNEPPPLARFHPETPGELQRILTKTLRKDRAQRYQTVQDLLLDLQALRDDLQSHPRLGSATVTPITTASAADGSAPPVAQTRRVNLRVALAVVAAMLLLGTVLGVWAWRTASRPQPPAVSGGAVVQRTLTRLTFGSGLQTDVTWSPDGRFIAYASDRSGNFDIWVQSVGGGDPVQVTRSAAHDLQPDWSSDGSTLVFRSERDGGGLFLVPALGGVERQLTSFGSYPFWSADNSEILFMDETRLGSSEGPVRLFVVSPEEGTPREILADFFSGGRWSWIGSHPDGRISATGKHRRLGHGFFTIARDGMQLVQSKESPGFPLRVEAGGGARRFRWHPSGTALYVQTQSNGVHNLWRVRVDPKTLLWVSAERLTTGAGPDVAPALSRDGTRLAFSTEQGTSRLWVFPFDPVARRLGSGRPLTEDGASAVTAALSPDGRSVAYTLLRPGIARAELRITDLVEGTSQLVATDGNDPCWSPDGKAIAYTYLRLDKQPIIGRTAVRQLGGKERFVSRWSTDLFMDYDWSAERGLVGTYVTSQSEVTSLAVWPLANPDANKPDRVLLSKPDTGFWQAQVSPNGRWLSFVAIRSDRPVTLELGVAAADGSHPEHWRRIAADHVWPDKPRWAHDGRTLYFISRRPTSYFNLWAVRFDPERGTPVDPPFALTHFDSQSLVISPEMTQSDMDVSSGHIVLTMKTVTGSIWMLDNVDK